MRRNAFLNVSNQLQNKDGWKLLVMQLKENMARQETERPGEEIIRLREFQKYDSALSGYLTGTSKYKVTK